MKKTVMTGGLIIFMLLILTALSLIYMKPRTSGMGKAFEQGILQATLNINNMRYGEFSRQLPLYLKCTFTNLSKGEPIDLSGLENLEPVLTKEAGGKPVKSTWERVPGETKPLLPGKKKSVYWVCRSRIEPGLYVMTLAEYPEMVNPAFVEITDKPAGKEEMAYFDRKLDIISGHHEEVIGVLKDALKESPNSIALRYQLAEAYAFAGDEQERQKQIREVVYRIQQAQEKHHQKPDIPDWIVFLQEKQEGP